LPRSTASSLDVPIWHVRFSNERIHVEPQRTQSSPRIPKVLSCGLGDLGGSPVTASVECRQGSGVTQPQTGRMTADVCSSGPQTDPI
jgi:hypothetical protein